MPKQDKKQIIEDNVWGTRIPQACRYYDQWAKRFKCNVLEDYYEGEQWKQQANLGYNPYTLNEVFDIIQIKIAQFIPTFPQFQLAPKPGNTDDFNTAADSAQLKEQTLNQLIQNDDTNFIDEVELAYKDSFFRFGMIEVGYGAEWILNPNAKKPLLSNDRDARSNRKEIEQLPQELPRNEQVFVKHIPARNFRIGGYDHKYLNRCGWCGYYEFVEKDDLWNLPGLINQKKIGDIGATYSSLYDEPDIEKPLTETPPKNTYKVWKIWDLRAMVQLLVLDSPKLTVFQRRFKRLPLFDIRPDKRLVVTGFYPIPQVFHWLSPQDELNETREQLRAHRRRFIRKYQAVTGMVTDEEIEKFETGPDGAVVRVKQPDAITPIQNADLGQAIDKAIMTSQDDLNRISGTSNQTQGVVDRSTATEAQLLNARGQVRENKDRDRVVKWICRIGRELLLTAKDKFVLGIWIELSSPEGEYTFGQAQTNNKSFKWVSHQDLNDGFDFRITVDLASLSVSEQQKEKQALFEFLAALTQFPMISFSPILVREIAYRIGYRNTRVIKEFQNQALAMELGRQAQLKQQMGGGNAAQQITQQATPPAASQVAQSMGQGQALVPNSPTGVQ